MGKAAEWQRDDEAQKRIQWARAALLRGTKAMAASRMIAAGIADQVEWPIVRGNPRPSQPRPAAATNAGESDAMAKNRRRNLAAIRLR
jgi:hypothetical protein